MTRIGERRLWKANLRRYQKMKKNFTTERLQQAFNAWVEYTATGSQDEPPRATMQ